MNGFFGDKVTKGFILGHVLASATGLVVLFGFVACGACVPDGDIVAAGKTVVGVVEMFCVVGRCVAACGGCASGDCWHCWNTWREREGASWCGEEWWVSGAAVGAIAIRSGGGHGRQLLCDCI